MLKFSNIYIKDKKFSKENEIFYEIFLNIFIFEIQNSK
jgi:hypothetical protein